MLAVPENLAVAPMERTKWLVTTPIVVAFLGIGALQTNPQAGPDLFALFWWAMMSALTVCFVALIRWGMGEEDAGGGPKAAKADAARHAPAGRPPTHL